MEARRGRHARRVVSAPLPGSMLDLIWILLFFFLMISTVRERERYARIDRVPLLDGGPAAPGGSGDTLVVTIDADSDLLVGERKVDLTTLGAELRRLRASRSSPPCVLLDVDRNARVEVLLGAEDCARAAGLECAVRRRLQPAPP